MKKYAVVERLATDLRREFPGVGGFSASNLWRMKNFFEVYKDCAKLAPLVREIGWSHNLVILEQCDDPLQREFYLRMTRTLFDQPNYATSACTFKRCSVVTACQMFNLSARRTIKSMRS